MFLHWLHWMPIIVIKTTSTSSSTSTTDSGISCKYSQPHSSCPTPDSATSIVTSATTTSGVYDFGSYISHSCSRYCIIISCQTSRWSCRRSWKEESQSSQVVSVNRMWSIWFDSNPLPFSPSLLQLQSATRVWPKIRSQTRLQDSLQESRWCMQEITPIPCILLKGSVWFWKE